MSTRQAPQRYRLDWVADPRPIPRYTRSVRAIIPNHRFLILHEHEGVVNLLVQRTDGAGDALFAMHRSDHDTEDAALEEAEKFLQILEDRRGLGFGGHS